MNTEMISTFSFTGKASYPKNAVALLYDLEGFSRFFNQPDVQEYVPVFLNYVSAAVGVNLFGGEAYWAYNATIDPLEIEVAHEKFMGDGALYILLPPAGASDFPAGTLQHLCNRLWTLKNRFDAVVNRSLEMVPVVEVPRKSGSGSHEVRCTNFRRRAQPPSNTSVSVLILPADFKNTARSWDLSRRLG